ncbi:hypothetical protein HRbin40_02475 [bacterium HR40]|nr:hypothetical protein HRbin40_02475 [bacterium HR40]
MASREDYYSLLGQIAEVRSRLAGLAAAQRPGDAELRELLATRLAELEETLTHHLEATRPPPPDGGDAERLGLGPTAAPTPDAVFTPAGVPPYDEAVVSERLLAIGDLYYCYQHERLGVFRAVLKLRELFRAGTLRLSSGPGAFALYRFDRKEALRYTRAQRMQAYRRVLGYTDAPPPPGARPNDAFHHLFTTFCLEVAQLFRDKRVAETIRGSASSPDPSFASVAAVRRAGLDLRANLKQASYGDVNVLTIELLQLLRQAFAILEAEDVRRQFGSDNAWDTLEEVLHRYLQERPVASQRSRMGMAGREIIHWLARPFILAEGRSEFETLVTAIGEWAEEWLTSAQSLGIAHRSTPAGNVVPFRPRRVAS